MTEKLQISDYKPLGIESESTEWFQRTFNNSNVILGNGVTPGSSDSGQARMTDNKKAMVIMAHPDDESEMTGGMIALLAQKGYEVTIVSMTDGSKGGNARSPMSTTDLINLRLQESLNAAKILGAHKLINLGAIDGELPMDPSDSPDLVEKLVKIMRENGGALYVTHPLKDNPTTYDYHSDHRNTTFFVERAIQLARNGNHSIELGQPLNNVPTLLYADPQNLKSAIAIRTRDVNKSAPVSFLLDITSVENQKSLAFSSHASQVNNLPDGLTLNYVQQRKNQDIFRARQMGILPYRFRRKRKIFAEGYGIHLAHGFNTNLSGIFTKQEISRSRKLNPRRRLVDFAK